MKLLIVSLLAFCALPAMAQPPATERPLWTIPAPCMEALYNRAAASSETNSAVPAFQEAMAITTIEHGPIPRITLWDSTLSIEVYRSSGRLIFGSVQDYGGDFYTTDRQGNLLAGFEGNQVAPDARGRMDITDRQTRAAFSVAMGYVYQAARQHGIC